MMLTLLYECLLFASVASQHRIGLFKMFSRWNLGFLRAQIHSYRVHKFPQLMCYNKVKHLLDIFKWGCGPFCVSLLTARLLKRLR